MNKIILRGRPTRDPETYSYTSNGEQKPITKFNFAVNKTFSRGEKTADFFTCIAYGRQAVTVEKYVRRGMHLLITGRMESNDYEKDGYKVYGYNLIVESLEFLDKKENSQSEAQEDENRFLQLPDDAEVPFA